MTKRVCRPAHVVVTPKHEISTPVWCLDLPPAPKAQGLAPAQHCLSPCPRLQPLRLPYAASVDILVSRRHGITGRAPRRAAQGGRTSIRAVAATSVVLAGAMLGTVCGSQANNIHSWQLSSAVPERDTDAYLAMLRTDYRFRIQEEYVYYTIDILIDPCRDEIRAGGLGAECCSSTNRMGCQDYSDMEAGPDLQVAYFQNAHIPNCIGTPFQGDPNCGTYLEVHRQSGDWREVLADVRIDTVPKPNGYMTTRIATHRLCMGIYDVWWVVRTRSGPYVQRNKSFFVTAPSCPAPPGSPAGPSEGITPRWMP